MLRKLLIIFCSVLGLSACKDELSKNDINKFNLAQLEAAKAQWNKIESVNPSYKLEVLQQTMFGNTTTTAIYESGEQVECSIESDLFFASETLPSAMPCEEAYILSLESYFDLIKNAIEQNAYSLSVDYHSELGYPTKIGIDYSSMIVDEESYYTINVELF